jgi:hypothetical protein
LEEIKMHSNGNGQLIFSQRKKRIEDVKGGDESPLPIIRGRFPME